MFDTHVHTKISTDSEMEIKDVIAASNKNGLGVIITEHMDLGLKDQNKFCFDVPNYFEKYTKYKNENLLLGIELGMEKELVEEGKNIILNNPFDYVIGSIHLIDGMDLYFNNYYKDKSKKEAYNIYLDHMIYNLKQYDFIDSLAHIDYISRYADYKDKEIYYSEFKDKIDEVLQIVAKKEIAIEINTRRLNDACALKNLLDIYKRFKTLGGRFVTIGSDAHNPLAIGNNYKVALEIAKACELQIIHHKNRKIYYDK